MKAVIFYMDGCPYCRKAKQALGELVRENPEYGKVEIEWINETTDPEKTEGYDYYYVPTVFSGRTKLYEAHPGDDYEKIRSGIKGALDTILSA